MTSMGNFPAARKSALWENLGMPLADHIRARMKAAGLNQKRLAVEAGLNETYVRDVLSGRSRNPTASKLAKIAAVLGCTLNDLGAADASDLSPKLAKDDQEVELLALWRDMTDDIRLHALALLRAMLDRIEATAGEGDDHSHPKVPASDCG